MTPTRKSELPAGFVEEFVQDDDYDGDLPDLPIGTIVVDPDCLLDELVDD